MFWDKPVGPVFDFALLDGAGGDADDGGEGVDVVDDDGACTDDRFVAYADGLHDGGTDADEGTCFGGDASCETCAGADVDSGSDHGFVVDDAAGVEDDGVADLAMGANECTGGDDDVSAQGGLMGDVCGGVDGVDELKAGSFAGVCESAADAVFSDGDDGGFDVVLVAEAFDLVDVAEDGHAVNAPAMGVGIRVEKPDDVVLAGGGENIENDPAVSSATDDDAIHAVSPQVMAG